MPANGWLIWKNSSVRCWQLFSGTSRILNSQNLKKEKAGNDFRLFVWGICPQISEGFNPAVIIRQTTVLDAGDDVVHFLADRADLVLVEHQCVVLVSQHTDR